jgi:hypothetical protein
MDQHLVDSVLERYRKEQAVRERALARTNPQPPQRREGVGSELAQVIASNASTAIVAVAAIVGFVALLIFAPHYWWVIFLLPWLLGALGWNRWSHRQRPPQGPYVRRIQGSSGANNRQASGQGTGQDVEIL